ncbi:Protein AE7 [Diplonema papillatum]|nr:Protein AE7 [Diplonema papillatum]KAJ9471308.1 Protein AE7 [Diplonema papillatum]
MDRIQLQRHLEGDGEDEEPYFELQTEVDGRPLTEEEEADHFMHDDAYEVLSVIRDPEHPDYTLGDLRVVQRGKIQVSYSEGFRRGVLRVVLTPTVPHCHLTTQIGLCVYERIMRYLPPLVRWKLELALTPGSHNDEKATTKQINDKERVCAALENEQLLREILKCTDDEVCA